MSKVINKIVKQELINWKNLKWFQPEKLKSTNQTITQKLKTSLIKNGFSMPFNVWQKGKDLWILDGHYRFSAMNAMEMRGVKKQANTTTNKLIGVFKEDFKCRQEFFNILKTT